MILMYFVIGLVAFVALYAAMVGGDEGVIIGEWHDGSD